MRKLVLSLAVFLAASGMSAEDVTLPAAASIVGGAPFFSDVRVFNTSYASPLTVTARYGCFISCTAIGVPEIEFTLAPRQSQAFNDMVNNTFQAPNTAGGVEFEHSGGSDQLVVTSRLYSTSPADSVGMFIPGLKNNEAHARTVLTSIRNGGPNQGFRTNVGAYNREDAAVTVTFTIFDGGTQVGSAVSRPVPANSGVQVNGIFGQAGQAGHVTDNAVVVVSATGEIFSYAAVLDNNTQDPIFVRGAEDRTPQQSQGPTTREVTVGHSGGFFDLVSQSTLSEVHVGDTVKWVWNGTTRHGVTSGTCTMGGYYEPGSCDFDGQFSSGARNGPYDFSHTFTEAGTFQYFCPVHGNSMRGRVVVSPAGSGARSGDSPSR
jgi:plastocyanin